MNLKVIFEDNHIIVVEKPAGVLSQAGSLEKPDMISIIKDYLKEKYNKPGNVYLGLVHRLDINVGGVMVFAKTSKAAKRLSESIRLHQLEKNYLAIIVGDFSKYENGEFKDYLSKDSDERKAYITQEGQGKLAHLKYKFLKVIEVNNQKLSLVSIDLVTGRFHQIRAQFAHHGYPLLGDIKYAELKPDGNYFLGLYAYKLSFIHPVKKEQISFSMMPDQEMFQKFLSNLDLTHLI